MGEGWEADEKEKHFQINQIAVRNVLVNNTLQKLLSQDSNERIPFKIAGMQFNLLMKVTYPVENCWVKK